MTLQKLIALLEGAEGPSPRLDNEICEALMGWPGKEWRSIDYMKTFGLAVTSSVDAAIALAEKVLPGWRNSSIKTSEGEYAGYVWERQEAFGGDFHVEGVRSSRAIALVLATLRALQAKRGDRT